jgi:hypothetical protein
MEGLDTGAVTAGDRRQLKTSNGLQRHGARNACRQAEQCTLQYNNYFMNEGQLTWLHKFLLLVTSSLQKSATTIPLPYVFNKFINNPLHK